jgi:hypothetical protein
MVARVVHCGWNLNRGSLVGLVECQAFGERKISSTSAHEARNATLDLRNSVRIPSFFSDFVALFSHHSSLIDAAIPKSILASVQWSAT